MKMLKRFVVVLLALVLLMGMIASCAQDDDPAPEVTAPANGEDAGGGGDAEDAEDVPEGDTADPPEDAPAGDADRVTLTMAVLTQKGGDDGVESQAFAEMMDILNINIVINAITEEQEQLMLSARDLPDILNASAVNMPSLIQGGLITPLDDLVAAHAPDIAADTIRLDFLRQFQSDGTGLLWGLTSFAGLEAPGFYPSIGFFGRWDLYSQLGHPPLRDQWDLLDVVYQMIQLEPETPDGLPVFGFGVFDGWGLWPYTVFTTEGDEFKPPYAVTSGAWTRTATGRETSNFTDLEGGFWSGFRFYNRAHQMGIFDVDSIVQPDSEYANKATNGQYMIINAPWWMFDFNQARRDEDIDTLVGYQFLPVEGSVLWANHNNVAGAVSFFNVISAESDYQVEAITFLNYLNSFDGIRQLMNGSLGDTIEEVDGRLEIKPEVIQARLEGDPAIANRFFENQNLFGWAVAHPHPDGQPINLFMTPRAFSFQNSALDQDYASFFGAEYPNGVLELFVQQGLMVDYRDVDNRIPSALQRDPDSIERIMGLLNEIMLRAAAAAVLAPDDAAFMDIYHQTVAELEASGLAEAIEWGRENWEQAEAQFR